MWELIANGINILGSIASTGSFISSFSIDRNRKRIEDSVLNIERQLVEFNKLFADIGRPEILEKYLDNLLKAKLSNEINSDKLLNALAATKLQNEELINTLLLSFNEIKQSYKYLQNDFVKNTLTFHRDLIKMPFDAGVSHFWDINSLNNLEIFPNLTASNTNTPILWTNPYNGHRYLGEIHNNNLSNYGIDIQLPHYRYNKDGFIYDKESGLYLPIFALTRS